MTFPAPALLHAKFDSALDYPAYLATAKPHELPNWTRFSERFSLTPAHRTLLGSFSRRINALCISGTWCGDCVQQVPFFHAIAQAAPDSVRLRVLDRGQHADLADQLQICGGRRVPILLLLNEDFDLLALLGDRSLSRYRAMAAKQLGASCPLPGAPIPADEIAATLADWVNEFERVHLMLRLSTKMRQRYGD